MKLLILFILTGLISLAAPNTPKAASIGLYGTSDLTIIPNDFDLNSVTGLSSGAPVSAFYGDQTLSPGDGGYGTSGGLKLSGNSTVTFTYLGMEAGYQNKFFLGNDEIFKTRGSGASVENDTYSFDYTDDGQNGFLDFSFWSSNDFGSNTDNAVFVPNGAIPGAYTIGYALLTDLSVTILFGDGWGDSDFDDMAVRMTITPSVIPLPPSVFLFGTALLGIGALARRRKNKAA